MKLRRVITIKAITPSRFRKPHAFLLIIALAFSSLVLTPSSSVATSSFLDLIPANYSGGSTWSSSGTTSSGVTLNNSPRFAPGNATRTGYFQFDGSSQQWMTDTTQLTNPTAFTVAIWFRANTGATGKLIGLEQRDSGGVAQNYDRLLYIDQAGKLRAGMYDGNYPSGLKTQPSLSAVTDGNWHHAVMTYSSSNLALYIDGVSQGSVSGTPFDYGSSPATWTIGGTALSNSWPGLSQNADYFTGGIGRITIDVTAKTSAEVTSLYSSAVAPTDYSLYNGTDGIVACGTSGYFVIQSNTAVGRYNCTGSVVIPSGVTAIADQAFDADSYWGGVGYYGNYDNSTVPTNITSLTIPNTVTSIGEYAFRSLNATSLTIPNSVTSMGIWTFAGSSSVQNLTISNRLTTIPAWAFAGMVGVTSLTIPDSVTSVGYESFAYMRGVTSLTLGSNLTTIDQGAFRDLDVVTSIVIPDAVTSMGDYAFNFSNGSRLTSLTIGKGLTSIGRDAFQGAVRLKELDIPRNISSIGDGAFSGLTQLETLTIASSVTSLGTSTFQLSTNVQRFNYCGALTSTDFTTASALYLYNMKVCGISAPGAPTSISATLTGNETATVSFTAPASNGGAAVASYTAISNPGNIRKTIYQSGSGSIVVNGLSSNTDYTFTVIASNWGLSSNASLASNSITTPGAPGAPTGVTATVTGAGNVDVSFTAPANNGGSPITSYTATSSPSGFTGTVNQAGSGTISITGLSTTTAYTFTVVATNVLGSSSASVASSAVTPRAAPSFTISTRSETVTAGTAITGYTITSTGGTITSYSVSPAITNTPGLSFNTSTGLISGTPTTPATARAYVITALNGTLPNATDTFTVTVSAPPPPAVTVGTTSFTRGISTNLGVTLANFDQNQSYQVTVKFINTQTNTDVTNGTLFATQGSTSLVAGYSSYSAAKLGFKGTYAQISAALTSIKWKPETVTAGISIRIGIASLPGANEYYDANSGHYYKFVSTGATWENARDAAERLILFGQRGYLAEVNTAAENNFIGTETTAINVWIGASDRITEGTWIWEGATSTYPRPVGSGTSSRGRNGNFASWAGGEPNDHPWYSSVIREDCAVTNWSGARGMWNDWPCPIAQSYLVEFGGRPDETSTAAMATTTTSLVVAAPVLYTITYNRNNGNSTPTQSSLTTGQNFLLANAITRTPSGGISYQFAGWSNGTSIYNAGETFTVGSANLTFTANWIQLYEVTYIGNGGTFTGGETEKDSECAANICSNNQSITLNAAPTRSGFTFDGWKDQTNTIVADSNPGTAGIQTTVTSNRFIFSATWTEITYTITYTSSGSAAPTQTPLPEGQFFAVGTAVTKANHRFDGWSDGNFTYQPDSDFLVETSNIGFTALWTPQYTVIYSEGLGSGTPETDTALYTTDDILVLVDDTNISRAGFTFGGWSDGTSVYQPGAAFTVGTGNMIFTAIWLSPAVAAQTTSKTSKPATIWIIDFDRNGASLGNAPAPIRYYADSKNSIELPGNIGLQLSAGTKFPMAKKGFTFLGWSTSKTGTVVLPEIFTPSGNTTLYAIWVASSTPKPTPKPTPTQTTVVNAQPKPEMAKVGTVYMANGSYFLNDLTKRTLAEIAEKINTSGAKSILVYGHTDNRGGVNNTVLSQNRAKAVAKYLRPLLITKKISIGWFASRKPVTTGKSEADLALNRRVEIYTK